MVWLESRGSSVSASYGVAYCGPATEIEAGETFRLWTHLVYHTRMFQFRTNVARALIISPFFNSRQIFEEKNGEHKGEQRRAAARTDELRAHTLEPGSE